MLSLKIEPTQPDTTCGRLRLCWNSGCRNSGCRDRGLDPMQTEDCTVHSLTSW